jgi:hypothetical protein
MRSETTSDPALELFLKAKASSKGQRAKGKEQRAKSKGQRAKSKEQRIDIYHKKD